MHLNTQIGERIRAERDRLGLTQQQAAAIAGIRREMWAKYEAGSEPGAKALSGMCLAGIDVPYLLTGQRPSDDPNRQTSAVLPDSNPQTFAGLAPDEQLLLEAYKGLTSAQRKQLLAQILTGEAGSAGKPAKVIAKAGSQAAGRDINNNKK